MIVFKTWFNNTWELLSLNGSNRMYITFEDFELNLKEAYEEGYKQCKLDLKNQEYNGTCDPNQ